MDVQEDFCQIVDANLNDVDVANFFWHSLLDVDVDATHTVLGIPFLMLTPI